MSLSPHSSFCSAPASLSLRSSLSSSKPHRSSYFPEFPLPKPIPPESLSFPAPSLGSNAVLPRPKYGAPPIDPPTVRVAHPIRDQGFLGHVKKAIGLKPKKPTKFHPAVCADWY